MDVVQILATLKRNKVGAMLVALQIALTLAVVANALGVIQRHWSDIRRPSGLDEANIFSIGNQWVGQPDDLSARISTDVGALRQLPGVVDAEATMGFPLSGNFFSGGVSLRPNQSVPTTLTSLYFNTVHGLTAQGLKLVEGRWFTANEVSENKLWQPKAAPSVVITAALAKRLFPDGHALGRLIYVTGFGNEPSRVIGIVERASAGSPGGGLMTVDFSTFLPFQIVDTFVYYVVRTQPGQQAAVMTAAKKRLLGISRMRILEGIQTFSQSRSQRFASAAATSWLLATVCTLLLIISACGTVGLTMLWVGQRRRQIGMRRALGAKRIDILSYFHTENLLIAGTGALLGIAGGLGANVWLANHLALTRMSPAYIGIGALIVLALSQLAVLWPAIRAAAVPPSLAARGL